MSSVPAFFLIRFTGQPLVTALEATAGVQLPVNEELLEDFGMTATLARVGGFRGRLRAALVVLAIAGYAVAWLQAERGGSLYDQYRLAHEACLSGDRAAAVDCNAEPAVRQFLDSHRRVYAIGDVALNGAALITLILLLRPLHSALRRRFSPGRQVAGGHTASDSP